MPQRLEGVEDGGDLIDALLRFAPEVGGESVGEISRGGGSGGMADRRQELALRPPPRRGGAHGPGRGFAGLGATQRAKESMPMANCRFPTLCR